MAGPGPGFWPTWTDEDIGMWKQVRVPVERLNQLDALEKELGGRIMNVHHLNDQEAVVEYVTAVNDSWFVEVWGGQAEVYVIDENGFIVPLVQKYEVHPEQQAPIIERVLADYGVSLEDTGQYYPISEEADEAFRNLVKSSKAKRRPFSRR